MGVGETVDKVKALFDSVGQNTEEAKARAKEDAKKTQGVIDAVFNSVEDLGKEFALSAGVKGDGYKATPETTDYDSPILR